MMYFATLMGVKNDSLGANLYETPAVESIDSIH